MTESGPHIPTRLPTANRPGNLGIAMNDDAGRLDAVAKVTGRAKFGRDVYPRDALFVSFIRCPYGKATLVETQIDTARAVDGVVDIVPDTISFLRGDCDNDGELRGTPSDAVVLLDWAFRASEAPACLAACDADANGRIQVTDALRVLQFVFLNRKPPAAPFPECGLRTETDEALGCARPSAACGNNL